MRIKRIDLIGFKSFCDKISVNFTAQTTCVVGPNGCGKSNIVDALRWAMGEQSARHLRGKAMGDVIFNGSDSRGPSGTAEVAITFENDGRVPVEYDGYSEITVTRRLHRDGTSEYLINKLPVRLRDVTNLFLGTGVGTKAYSIIEQGRVGLIVSAKPEDRRLFIEEAAGITKYRRRKEAAERKMDATRQNLLRVNDILEELNGRLGSLRRQAKKAERYRQYADEMRDIELWHATHRLLGFMAQRKVALEHVGRFDSTRRDVEVALVEREAALEARRLEAASAEGEINHLLEQQYQLENSIKLGESEIEHQRREARDLERRVSEARGEAQSLGAQLGDFVEQIARVQMQVENAEQRRKEFATRLSLAEDEFEQASQALQEVDSVIDSARQDLTGAQRTIERETASLAALAQRRSDLTQRQEQLSRESQSVLNRRAELEAQTQNLDGELSSLRENLDQLRGKKGEMERRVRELHDVVQRGDAEIEVHRTELHRRKSRLASLREIQARYEGFGDGTREIMQRHNGSSAEKGILGLVAEVLDAPPQYEAALEAVLGRRLETVIVADTEVGREAIDYLKHQRKGRTSFISASSPVSMPADDTVSLGFVWQPGVEGTPVRVSDGDLQAISAPGVQGPMLNFVHCDTVHRPVAERLLRDVLLVDDLSRAIDVWPTAPSKTLVTMDGEILEPDGTLTGGTGEVELGGILRQRREIKELEEIIVDLESQYQSRMEAHVAVKTEVASLNQMMEALTDEGHQSDKAALTREKDLGSIRAELEQIGQRHAQLEQALEQTHATLDATAREVAEREESLRAAQEVEREAEQRQNEATEQRRAVADEVETAQEAVVSVKVEFAQAETSYQAAFEQQSQLTSLQREREERKLRLLRGADTDMARAQELIASAAERSVAMEEMATRNATLQSDLSAARSAYDVLVGSVGELEGTIKEFRRQMNDLAANLNQQQLRLSELTMSESHLEEQIQQRYRESLRRMAGDYHLRAPVTEAEVKRLDELREIIQRMGDINLTAIQEYDELSKRQTFLQTQRDDLESALNQLTRAIQKINRTCRKRFLETFEVVNERFQEIFPRLFRGGKARLVLTEADDVLSGGVDIVAQPPGKKLQSLEMMSGGEKALTAVSLIFAMFMVKPTPFCLLDEVDAPLDDANVIRFRELIRELSNTSQFIIITHNRSTMEIGDCLYGVTMEEPGISKMVSVNLREAQAVVA